MLFKAINIPLLIVFRLVNFLFYIIQVADSLDLDPIPSAYQIRYGGCKGMLAIDPRLPQGEDQEILQWRKSMKKFSSSHLALEICEATKPSKLLRSMTFLIRNFKHPNQNLCLYIVYWCPFIEQRFFQFNDQMFYQKNFNKKVCNNLQYRCRTKFQ